MGLRILDSAHKHGIQDEDIIFAVEHSIEVIELEPDPQKLLYIGFDRTLRVLEIITVVKINGEEIVIHAMKATKKALKILEALQNGGN
jgi:hypothetical protein